MPATRSRHLDAYMRAQIHNTANLAHFGFQLVFIFCLASKMEGLRGVQGGLTNDLLQFMLGLGPMLRRAKDPFESDFVDLGMVSFEV